MTKSPNDSAIELMAILVAHLQGLSTPAEVKEAATTAVCVGAHFLANAEGKRCARDVLMQAMVQVDAPMPALLTHGVH